MTRSHALLAAGALLVVVVVFATGQAPPVEKPKADAARALLFDGFDGKLGLNWHVVRPDEKAVSLKANPGQLTITTRKGTIHADAEAPGLHAKNLHLLDTPVARGGDFVITTCVVGFAPTHAYHQAGVILYDDDDNYLKWVYQYHWQKGEGACFALVNEAAGKPEHAHADADPEVNKVWLRLTKAGDRYDYATSIDGEKFVTHGTTAWGKGGPKRVGLIAKNGGVDVPEIDARFDFFEFKTP